MPFFFSRDFPLKTAAFLSFLPAVAADGCIPDFFFSLKKKQKLLDDWGLGRSARLIISHMAKQKMKHWRGEVCIGWKVFRGTTKPPISIGVYVCANFRINLTLMTSYLIDNLKFAPSPKNVFFFFLNAKKN